MKKQIVSLAMLVVMSLVFAACGNDAGTSSKTAAGETKEITIHAKNFEFDQKEIRVNKGDTVKLTLENTQGSHSVKIDGYNKEIQAGKTVTFTADKTGEFKFICNVFCGQGHGEMTGKLIVQ
ncbi:cupredoxin domain-containing protein [Paenibacillus sp. GCM10027628]|uniref:cupredoxin domain-containing protein n=1 Tax=Paenibacillus sp. GCM10027628 TaxID=3273413 RepID=UPI00363E6F79